jgi:hypothetical protein
LALIKQYKLELLAGTGMGRVKNTWGLPVQFTSCRSISGTVIGRPALAAVMAAGDVTAALDAIRKLALTSCHPRLTIKIPA